MKELLQSNQQLINAVQTQAGGKGSTAKAEPETPELDEAAVERMSRKELIGHIQKMNSATVEKMLKDQVGPRLEALQKGLANVDVSQMISSLSSSHKDFKEWLPEINDLAGKGVNLDPESMYLLVRAQNAEKAAEMDKKYGSSEGEGSDDAGFGGLPPGQAPQRVEKTDMDESDAGTTAWNEVMGHLSSEDQQQLLRTEDTL